LTHSFIIIINQQLDQQTGTPEDEKKGQCTILKRAFFDEKWALLTALPALAVPASLVSLKKSYHMHAFANDIISLRIIFSISKNYGISRNRHFISVSW